MGSENSPPELSLDTPPLNFFAGFPPAANVVDGLSGFAESSLSVAGWRREDFGPAGFVPRANKSPA